VLALLAARLGRWQEAESFFQQALHKLEELDARPYLARTRYEYGRALLQLGHADALQRGRGLIEAAGALAAALEMPGLRRLCERRLSTGLPTSRPPPSAARPAESTFATTAGLPFSLLLDGETWSVTYREQTFRLRDSLGLRYLSRLCEQPNRGLSALEISGSSPSDDAVVDQGDSGELLDEQARESYRARRLELQQELEEAEGFSDLGRASQARQELEFLAAELSRAVGLGGRARRAGGARRSGRAPW